MFLDSLTQVPSVLLYFVYMNVMRLHYLIMHSMQIQLVLGLESQSKILIGSRRLGQLYQIALSQV